VSRTFLVDASLGKNVFVANTTSSAPPPTTKKHFGLRIRKEHAESKLRFLSTSDENHHKYVQNGYNGK